MSRSGLTEWLDAAGRIPRITPAQEIMLGRQVQAAASLPATGRTPEQERIAKRGLRAQQRLTTANLRLVWSVVMGTPTRPSKYVRRVPPDQLPDLLQMGAEGMFHAASKFDPEAGCRFSTYAAWWIRERCQHHLDRATRAIRIPTTLTNAARKLPRVQSLLQQQLGRMPTAAELAEALNLSETEAELLVERLQPVLSLDCEVDNSSFGDLIADQIAGCESSFTVQL